MTTFRVTERATADLERLYEFLRKSDPVTADETADVIVGGLRHLVTHPLVGRPLNANLPELVLSRGHSGYLALYEYHLLDDSVTVHAIRHQRESGFDE